jgi:hypothetical protein
MECPFHPGNEAITVCVQCGNPICPLCASETNQIHLCLNCYHARVEDLSAGLSSASVMLAKERQKGEAKALISRKKKKKAAKSAPEAAAPAEQLIAPPQEALSKKELARMQKEEAKRLKEEEKAAKKAAKSAPEAAAVPPVPEPAPFFEPAPEASEYIPPVEAAPLFETMPAPEEPVMPEAAPFETAPPPASQPLSEMPPPGYPSEPPSGGVRIPSLDERLEPLPPKEEEGEIGFPPGLEPPEGFFD